MPTPPSLSLLESYQLWLTAEGKWEAVAKFIRNSTLPTVHPDIIDHVIDENIQGFYETILTPEERAAWDKWVSGGTATPEEWAQIAGYQMQQATSGPAPTDTTDTTAPKLSNLLTGPSYAWIIIDDLDNGYDDDTDLGLPNRVGVAGPRGATPALIQQALDTGQFFRLLDDDGHPYYVGKIWTDGTDDDDLFGPLRDYGTPDVGATTIEYRNHDKKQWEAL